VTDIEEYMKVGQQIEVKLIGIDTSTGKLKLSRKALVTGSSTKAIIFLKHNCAGIVQITLDLYSH